MVVCRIVYIDRDLEVIETTIDLTKYLLDHGVDSQHVYSIDMNLKRNYGDDKFGVEVFLSIFDRDDPGDYEEMYYDPADYPDIDLNGYQFFLDISGFLVAEGYNPSTVCSVMGAYDAADLVYIDEDNRKAGGRTFKTPAAITGFAVLTSTVGYRPDQDLTIPIASNLFLEED